MSEVTDATHTHKRNFRLDANKDHSRDEWFTRNLLAKIAPKEDSKLVTQLDMKNSALVHTNNLFTLLSFPTF